jgi:hypothetical protein
VLTGRIGLVLLTFAAGLVAAAIAGIAVIIYVPYAAVGAMLIIRRPKNPIGWLLTAVAWGFALGFQPVNATPEELRTLTAPPIVLAIAWIKWWWSFPLIITLISVITITFPTGRLPAGRWRRPAQLMIITTASVTLVAAIWPFVNAQPDGGGDPFRMPNPLRLVPPEAFATDPGDVSGVVGPLMFPLMFALLVAAIVSMLVRFVRARGTERLQLRWLVAGLASLVMAIPLGFLLFAVFGSAISGLAWLPAIVSFALPPIAIGIAVLRYRLYEIDRLISRTIGWAVVTGVLATVFAVGVLALQAILAGFTQGQSLAVAASTLIAFALFQPVRRRVQRAVDHRFDRARYDGERTAAAFGDRLRVELDLADLETDIADTIRVALRPSSTGVWIRVRRREAAP